MISLSLSPRLFLAGWMVACGVALVPHAAAAQSTDGLETAIRSIEADMKAGTIGVALNDTQGDFNWSYRGDERFPMNSSFKAFACAALLSQVDDGVSDLGTPFAIKDGTLIHWSPITEKRVGSSMTLRELCEAALTMSDNTAANAILDTIGGPSGFTDFMTSIGDETTRLDRREPELNEAVPGDPRDTTTPNAAITSLQALLHGNMLSPRSREVLETWMINDKVANDLVRKVLPKGWKIADKTGAGGHGSRGIVAMVTPPQKEPLFLAIYLRDTQMDLKQRNATIARVADVILKRVAQ
ncbi:class A beta-lactamase [uncultured Cohaesibacter sp.]|uniref:class A beta-lactamase n=1 Tax=uncultured Cohaesibacter sp. TaxID=1002546 RepID=UPI0029C994B8|nr:class A beta-lactamase [uncultured Cohaesibacter sp.]